MRLAAPADQFQRTVLDDITGGRGHIEDLPALRHACLLLRQWVVTTSALRWQWVGHDLGRPLDLHKRCPFVTDLPTGLLAGRLTQGARLASLLCKAV
ncbi:hypothetical protein BSU04_26335 [Caballeronia sordidicola]|uniref:Uncharacterized protein n=1 Tax=Caballeronia sordidicola TaxID=196367 RepID=A0A226WWQ6_CABSO|nr:hypothetical protein BSU04_26335 [Caballeronia sordidicola]